MRSLKIQKTNNYLADEVKIKRLSPIYKATCLVEVTVLMNPYSRRYDVEYLTFKLDIEEKDFVLQAVPEFVNFCNKSTSFYDPHLPNINSLFP